MPALYDQFFLFGDSITQDSFNQERGSGFAAALQHAYIRRLDVINRGFSGYNTEQALKVLPTILPSPEEARIRFLMIFFGANDAASPQTENNQHIPLDEYKKNLEKIVTHPLVAAHKTRIIIVAPPPINEHLQWISDKQKGLLEVSRLAANTKAYADAACEVGIKLKVPVVNLWKAFMSEAKWNAAAWKNDDSLPGSLDLAQNDALVELMYDGLHFSPSGYTILLEEMMKVIAAEWPEQLPQKLPTVLPIWNDTEAWTAFEKST
ncbi:SGNH hydrolase-type esterase domain-containing protein [Clohesyomyces aquaticus]|uniref:SGNH hydrolase-type esterase domain-containing protein n=1 Tax=Clohesyomyces aquaticus TaxID=1231657 RepID=A0A1Y1YX04_9PLEO|nr:SGNH hydrolase-type esterase domain-containing protein [Clohesyomyces aquaticus]